MHNFAHEKDIANFAITGLYHPHPAEVTENLIHATRYASQDNAWSARWQEAATKDYSLHPTSVSEFAGNTKNAKGIRRALLVLHKTPSLEFDNLAFHCPPEYA